MAEQTQVSPREQLKDSSKEQFLSDNTRAEMEAFATELGIEDPSAPSTKSDLYDALIEAADLPDPSLRGESSIDSPVAYVWEKAEEMFLAAREADEDPPRRKDVVNACIEDGVAYYTARTQYQAWFSHTQGGEKLIADGNTDGLPRSVAGEPEEEATDEE